MNDVTRTSKDEVSYLLAKLCWHTCTCQNATSPSVQHGVYCVYEQVRAAMPTHEPPPAVPAAWLRRFQDGTYDVFHDRPRNSDVSDRKPWRVVPLYEQSTSPSEMAPTAWMRGHRSYSPGEPDDYDVECVYGDDPPDDSGKWIPLYRRPSHEPLPESGKGADETSRVFQAPTAEGSLPNNSALNYAAETVIDAYQSRFETGDGNYFGPIDAEIAVLRSALTKPAEPCEKCGGSGRLMIYDKSLYMGQLCSPIGDEPCPACSSEGE